MATTVAPAGPAFRDRHRLSDADLAAIERQTQRLGREVLAHMRAHRPRPWQRAWWDDRAMQLAGSDPVLKVRICRSTFSTWPIACRRRRLRS